MLDNQQSVNGQGQAQQNQQPIQQQVVQPPVQPTVLPDDARDRTKEQFEKLLDSNRRLNQENEMMRREIEQRQNVNQTFQPIQQVQPIAQHPARQQVNPEDFIDIDPATGQPFINDYKLRQKIDEINQKASQAEKTIQNYIQSAEQREIERQNREAFDAHPELNPQSEKFDKELNKQVRGIILDSMYSPEDYGGRPLSFREAGDYIKAKFTKEQIQQDQQQKAEQVNQNTQTQGNALKEQSAAQITNQSAPQQRQAMQDSEEMRQLVYATRIGSPEALAQRIMQTEHTRKEGAA